MGTLFNMDEGQKYCKSMNSVLAQPHDFMSLITSLRDLLNINGK